MNKILWKDSSLIVQYFFSTGGWAIDLQKKIINIIS